MAVYKPLLIIKTGNTIAELRQKGEDFEHWFADSGGLPLNDCQVISLFLGEALPPPETVGAIIITGSPAYVTDLEPWNQLGARYLRRAHELSIPILGVCYGHQLLAWAFGGEVDFNPHGRQIGSVGMELTEAGAGDRLLGRLPLSCKVQVSHQQAVVTLPPAATRLAARPADANHAFRLGDCTWGVQFHPEFDAAVTRAYIQARQRALGAEGIDVAERLETLTETPEAAALLRYFVRLRVPA